MRIHPKSALTVLAGVLIACASPQHDSLKPDLVPNPHFSSPEGPYGYSETNPIMVGSLGGSNRAENEHIYLRRLRTLDGLPVAYERIGSCCGFPTPNPHYGDIGLLDRYAVFVDPVAEPVILYLNMYDPGKVWAPDGFMLIE